VAAGYFFKHYEKIAFCLPMSGNNGKKIMNRKKKLNDAFKKRLKKMNAKLRVNNKPKYISKSERESLAVTEARLHDQ
jgi:hypothetical protein